MLTSVVGYFPSWTVGLGEDLPAGVARGWARWGRHSEYVVDASGEPIRERYRSFAGSVRAYSFTDDTLAPRLAVEALLELFASARVEHRRLSPEDLGRDRIGHFLFFREEMRDTLWTESAEWLAGTR